MSFRSRAERGRRQPLLPLIASWVAAEENDDGMAVDVHRQRSRGSDVIACSLTGECRAGLESLSPLKQTAVLMSKPVTLFVLMLLVPPSTLAATVRTVDATFAARLSGIPANANRIRVWIPLPRDSKSQTIQHLQVDSRHEWTRYTEPEFGNVYLYSEIENPEEEMEVLRLRFQATRREVTFEQITPIPVTRRELRRNLRPDRLVTLSPRIRRLAKEVTRGKKEPLAQAKAIYDHVLATMKYDKSSPGWGNGDTERACDLRRGNCTDFHSLFISLVRAKGIPARFIMGFSMSAGEGQTSGYHCWAEFYIAGKGWIPADPSEASKTDDPTRREYLFGNVDAQRLEFTIGRDIRLEPPTAEPLNYFIYPYAEMNGEAIGHPAISLVFRDLVSERPAGAGAEAGVDIAPARLKEVPEAGAHQP